MIPFDPFKKSQMTVTRVKKGDKTVRVVLKGAPEIVIDHCNQTLSDEMGDPIKFTPEIKK